MKPRSNTPRKVIWHHGNGVLFFPCASTQHHTADIVDEAHKQRWPGFTSQVYKNSKGEYFHTGYHLVIDLMNETITKTRAFYEEGAACIGMNRSAIQPLIMGNYDECSGDKIPKDKEWLIYKAWEMIQEEYPNLVSSDNVPHRTYASKSCYGNSLSDTYIQDVIIQNRIQTMTVGDAIINEEKERQLETITKMLIDLIQKYIAILLQEWSGKRLSLREFKKIV